MIFDQQLNKLSLTYNVSASICALLQNVTEKICSKNYLNLENLNVHSVWLWSIL